MKKIYIAGTGIDSGKTTTSFLIIKYLTNYGYKVGYLKPIAQESVANLSDIKQTLRLINAYYDENLINSLTIKKGMTENRDGINMNTIISNIDRSIIDLEENNCDFAIIEGTGHAAVGTVLQINNAAIVKHLKANTILVTAGGIGSTIDRVELNINYFLHNQIYINSIIINNIIEKKMKSIITSVDDDLEKMGLINRCYLPSIGGYGMYSMQEVADLIHCDTIKDQYLRVVYRLEDIKHNDSNLLCVLNNIKEVIIVVEQYEVTLSTFICVDCSMQAEFNGNKVIGINMSYQTLTKIIKSMCMKAKVFQSDINLLYENVKRLTPNFESFIERVS